MRPRAFTLIELLVVISIIALLIGILLPALASARSSAKQLRVKSDLKQLMTGYTAYQVDYKGHLMFAYPPTTFKGEMLIVKFGELSFAPPVSQRYPWRLVPYVADVWEVLHNHKDMPEMPSADDAHSVAYLKAYYLSLNPTYGMNDVYVGGSVNNNGFNGEQPNRGKHVVFSNGEVFRPSELIVLGDSQVRNIYPTPDQPQEGYFRLTPPRATASSRAQAGDDIELSTGAIVGIPKGRYGPTAAMGFFDGHVGDMSPTELQDMHYWANNATTPDYDFTP